MSKTYDMVLLNIRVEPISLVASSPCLRSILKNTCGLIMTQIHKRYMILTCRDEPAGTPNTFTRITLFAGM